MKQHNKKNRNVIRQKIVEAISISPCWAAFNINFIMRGYDLDADALLVLIYCAFQTTLLFDNFQSFVKTFHSKSIELSKIRDNAQQILLDACELNDVIFDDDMVNIIMQKIIFSKNTFSFFMLMSTCREDLP